MECVALTYSTFFLKKIDTPLDFPIKIIILVDMENKKIPWKEVEELLKKTYRIKSVQLTAGYYESRPDKTEEIEEYPDYVEGIKEEC